MIFRYFFRLFIAKIIMTEVLVFRGSGFWVQRFRVKTTLNAEP
jgi:hypothetical protein